MNKTGCAAMSSDRRHPNRARLSLPALFFLIVSIGPLLPQARADHLRDHEIARQALLRGEILPLETLLAEVRKAFEGEFIGVELELKQGAWVYVLKILTRDGKLLRIVADARTGAVLTSRKDRDG